MVLGHKERGWKAAQKEMANPSGFLGQLQNADPSNITGKKRLALQKLVKDFTVEGLKSISAAIASMFKCLVHLNQAV